MADVAAVFHWPPETMRGMEIEELLDWRKLAVERAKAMAGAGG